MGNNLPKIVFLSSLGIVVCASAFLYGAVAHRYKLPPVPQLLSLYDTVSEVVNPSDRILETTEGISEVAVETVFPDAMQPGLLMVAVNINRRRTAVRIVDRSGAVLHEWTPVFSEIWPEGSGSFIKRPAVDMFLHGVVVLPDGSLVANFENLSTFRLSPCGDVMWKLDNNGHHSVHYAEDGTLWVGAEDNFGADMPTGYPNHKGPFRSWTLQNLTVDGELIRSIPVVDILMQNGLEGLLYMSNIKNRAPVVVGDTLHLNDIDIFPSTMASDVFEPGDILFSLRNINGVFVADPETLELKFQSVGYVMRHHDPDFLPGDRISVFDNRNFTVDPITGPARSRIVEFDAKTGAMSVVLGAGEDEYPFFTEIMGNHQWLENGNVLVASTGEGRLIEYTADGDMVWRMDNTVDGKNLSMMAGWVLPPEQDEAFFASIKATCGGNN